MARDHYVPQFYLRNFQIPTKPGHVYLYKRSVPPKPQSIRQVAQDDNYYDINLDDPEVDKRGVDKLLQMSERSAAPVISKLITGSLVDLSNEDFFHLTWFTSLLGSRTPAVRETLASIQVGIENRDFKRMLCDETEFAKLVQQYPEMTPDELEKSRTAFLNGDLKLDFKRGGQTEDFLMSGQLQFAEILVDILEHRHWSLIETVSSRSFLTSDNPLINMPSPGHPQGETWGVANGDILLPLSPKRALLFVSRRLKDKVIEIHRDKMPEFQFYIITNCKSEVYSHVLSKDFQRKLDGTEEGKAQTAIVPGA
ncbi:MAG TPA: hypothetical protein DC047_04850 [Blastocatellia bacterium]|nr:hypothetical protein [Blastocatellia bacterium]